MRYSSIYTIMAMAFMMSCSCDSQTSNQTPEPAPEPTPTPEPTVEVAKSYTTTADKSSLFAEKTIAFGKTASMSPYAVRFTDETYQTVDGFGAALTVASCYNILKMPQDKREAFLKHMFDTENGIGSSLIRVCIGGSDFSIHRFTWCDKEGIENFAPADDDVKYVIPVLKEIKKIKDIPVIMLSARGEEYDKLFGFELGIDDYVVKPFSPKELMARVNAVLARSSAKQEEQPEILKFDGLEINIPARTVTVDGKKVELTPKEYELLFYLVENKNIALSRNKLLSDIWGYDFFGDDRTIDTHIKNLRNNLGPYRDYIVTLRGVGYKFEV